MAATASASSNGPRYAPEDPTLPKPWKGLVDGKTGYLYFWNPETNVTQYERPVAASRTGPTPPQKSSSIPISSSVQVQQSPQEKSHYNSSNEKDFHGDGGSEDGSKLTTVLGAKNHRGARNGPINAHSTSNGMINAANVGSGMYDHKPGSHGIKSYSKGHGSSGLGIGSSAESYRHQHEISVTGDEVPAPYTSFESTGFPSEILREVRYLLQGGANVVRCANLFLGACI